MRDGHAEEINGKVFWIRHGSQRCVPCDLFAMTSLDARWSDPDVEDDEREVWIWQVEDGGHVTEARCNSTENTAATSMAGVTPARKAAHDPTTPEHVWLDQWLRLFGTRHDDACAASGNFDPVGDCDCGLR